LDDFDLAASEPMVTVFITRAGMGFCVRPNRYALALATGSDLGADVFALHECGNLCASK
jgi:hypothetical protein